MSLDRFRDQVATDVRRKMDSDELRKQADAEKLRRRLECGMAGIVTISTVARTAQYFDDFPKAVSLAAPNGFNAGLSVTRTDRTWRLGGDLSALYAASTYGFGATPPWVEMLAAMQIPHSPDAYMSLKSLASPGGGSERVVEDLFKALADMPRHCTPAAVGLGASLLTKLSVQFKDFENAAKLLVATALDRGASLTAAPAEGVSSPVEMLAESNDVPVLNAVLAALPPGDSALVRAAHTAAASVRRSALERILAHGVDVNALNVRGGTLLHSLADGVAASPETVDEATDMLDLLGNVDRGALDSDEWTASRLVKAAASEADNLLDDGRLSRLLEGFADALDHPSGPKP